MALSATELYVESSYIEDGYVGGVAEAVIGISPYVEEGYIQAGYVENKGGVFTLVADLTTAIIQADAVLASVASISCVAGTLENADAVLQTSFELGTVEEGINLGTVNANIVASGEIAITDAFATTITVNAIRTTDISLDVQFDFAVTTQVIANAESLLSYLAALDAQAAKFTGGVSALNSSATVDVISAVSSNGAADLVSTVNLIAQVDNVQFADVDVTVTTTATASAIEYRSRFLDSDRPIGWSVRGYNPSNESYFDSNDYAFNSSVKKYGTASLELTNTNRFARSDPMDFTGFSSTTGSYVLEFWSRHEGIFSGDVMIAQVSDDDNALFDNIDRFATPVFRNRIRLYRESDTSRIGLRIADLLLSTNTVYNSGTWYHFAITVNSGTVTLYINGSSVASSSGAVIGLSNPRAMLINDSNSNVSAYFDNARFAINTTDFHHNTDADNDTNTKFLARFDGNFNDDTSITFSETKTLNGAFSQSVDAIHNVEAGADLTAFYSQVSVTGFVSDFFVNMDSAFVQTGSIDRVRSGAASINSEFNTTTVANTQSVGTATLSSNSNISTEGDRIRFGDSVLSSEFAVAADVNNTVAGSGSFNTQFVQTSTVDRIRSSSSNVATNWSINVDGQLIVSGGADLTVTTSVAGSANRTRSALVDFDSVTSQLTAAGKTADFFVNMDNVVSIGVDAVKLTDVGADLLANSAVAVTVEKFAGANSTLSSVFSLETDNVSTKSGVVSATSTATVAVDVIRQRGAAGAFNSVANLQSDATRIQPFGMSVVGVFDLSVDANITRGSIVEANTITSISVLGGSIFDTGADLLGFASIVTVNKILHVDQYIHNIPSESRNYTILRETRSYTIPAENRSYNIKGT